MNDLILYTTTLPMRAERAETLDWPAMPAEAMGSGDFYQVVHTRDGDPLVAVAPALTRPALAPETF